LNSGDSLLIALNFLSIEYRPEREAIVILEFADCRIDTASRELSRGGRPVAIEPRTLELLLYLVENHDRAIGKDELQDKVWGTIVTEAALTRAVMKLRKALGDPTSEASIIRTVPRFGYHFVANINQAEPAPSQSPGRTSIAVLPLAKMSDDAGTNYHATHRRQRRCASVERNL
jgi:DNA-binding winged helix-turn-helix (wHTH) protein